MKLRALAEEWTKEYVKTVIDGEDISFPIHSNPTIDDYNEMRKENGTQEFRYIVKIYGDLVLYIFDSRVLHFQAAEKLGIGYKSRVHLPVWGDYAFGISKVSNNKLELTEGILKELRNMATHVPYGFLNQYFSNAPQKPEKKERRKLFRS